MADPKKKPKPLTEKQKRFCEQYLVDLNGTQAAIRSGYTVRSADVTAAKMLRIASIQAYISQLRKKESEKLEITRERVLQEIAAVAFSNIQNFVGNENVVLNVKDLPQVYGKAIQQIETTETFRKVGDETIREVTTKLKLHPKISGLDQLARHLGLFEKDNEQSRAVVELNISSAKAKPEK